VSGLAGIGLFLDVVAGVMAFLITYEENLHHFPSRREARRRSRGSALGAFAFFALLELVVFFVLRRFLGL
jgi:hypothetical protein